MRRAARASGGAAVAAARRAAPSCWGRCRRSTRRGSDRRCVADTPHARSPAKKSKSEGTHRTARAEAEAGGRVAKKWVDWGRHEATT